MGKSIDLILHGARSGEENMTLDREALARAERGEASLRIYGWDRPTVTLGKSQRAEDVAELFPNLPTVSRPTGGGAVLHGFDATVALAMPLEMLGVKPREVRETYTRLVAPLAEALTACGLSCSLAEDRASGSAVDCFASSGRLDLLHSESGRKVAGCALAATRDAALLHVSIPIGTPPEWLRLSPATLSNYANPEWRTVWLSQALTAALRSGYRVKLAALDPKLSVRERTDALLWHEADPLKLNHHVGAVGEYDDYAEELSEASTRSQVQAGIDRMGRWMRTSPHLDATTFLSRRAGF